VRQKFGTDIRERDR